MDTKFGAGGGRAFRIFGGRMSDANDNENRGPRERAPLTLKPRGGAVNAGTVKQSFDAAGQTLKKAAAVPASVAQAAVRKTAGASRKRAAARSKG